MVDKALQQAIEIASKWETYAVSPQGKTVASAIVTDLKGLRPKYDMPVIETVQCPVMWACRFKLDGAIETGSLSDTRKSSIRLLQSLPVGHDEKSGDVSWNELKESGWEVVKVSIVPIKRQILEGN